MGRYRIVNQGRMVKKSYREGLGIKRGVGGELVRRIKRGSMRG